VPALARKIILKRFPALITTEQCVSWDQKPVFWTQNEDMCTQILFFNKIIELPRLCAFKPKFAHRLCAFNHFLFLG